MARIRTIKPDFFTSEDIVSLSTLARLLFIATWLEADREGRLVWRPKTLKLRYLPGDNCEIEKLADELLHTGLVVTYEVGGQTYAETLTSSKRTAMNALDKRIYSLEASIVKSMTDEQLKALCADHPELDFSGFSDSELITFVDGRADEKLLGKISAMQKNAKGKSNA